MARGILRAHRSAGARRTAHAEADEIREPPDTAGRHDLRFEARSEIYAQLKLETQAGEHAALMRQVAFLLPGSVKYIADFVTLEKDGSFRVWDAKSSATARDKTYRIKKRLMRECMGIRIIEI